MILAYSARSSPVMSKHRVLDRLEATSGASAEPELFEELTYEIRVMLPPNRRSGQQSSANPKSPRTDAMQSPSIMRWMNCSTDLAATDMATGGWLTKFRTVKEE